MDVPDLLQTDMEAFESPDPDVPTELGRWDEEDDDLEEMIGVDENEEDETVQYPLQQVIEEVVLEDQIQYIIS